MPHFSQHYVMISVPKLVPYFLPIFANFQNEVDCLSVNSVVDRDPKWLFFMSWSNLRFWLSNPSRIFEIDAMVTFLWLVKRAYFFWLTRQVNGSRQICFARCIVGTCERREIQCRIHGKCKQWSNCWSWNFPAAGKQTKLNLIGRIRHVTHLRANSVHLGYSSRSILRVDCTGNSL